MYHSDDKLGAQFAGVIFQKGFDNVWLLTGGIEEFFQACPEYCIGRQFPVLKSDLGEALLTKQNKPKS